MCPYLGSGNPLYAGFYECDLTRRPTLCSGDPSFCEAPQKREKEDKNWPIVVEEPDVDREDELLREADARMEWLEIQDYTKHVQGK